MIPYAHRKEVIHVVNEMLEKRFIQDSFSPWASPIIRLPSGVRKCSSLPIWSPHRGYYQTLSNEIVSCSYKINVKVPDFDI